MQSFAHHPTLDPRACDRARRTRDPRFDGLFFTAVTSTGIYCRPVCPAPAPKRHNIRYYDSAAAAAAAGFRPCLRCRPEAAPGSPLHRAKSDLENALRSAGLQTRQAYLGVVNGLAQVRALKQALKSSESLLEASKLGQEVGARTNLDVLNAQQQLYATRRDLCQAQYNYLMSGLRLKAAVGGLSEQDLAEVNRALR